MDSGNQCLSTKTVRVAKPACPSNEVTVPAVILNPHANTRNIN